jgi:non-specific serine/threonine protein kinase/serine/threonine-protein kinase
MNSTRWRQVKEVLGATLDRHPSERPSFLAEVCGEDSDLRAEVESLLASHEDAGEFLDTPPSMSPIAARVACGEEMVGATIGRYRLVSKIGHGGMGTVYRAVRADDEFQQQVAIKLISRGMDSDFIISRFRHERQILASLEHANIARLLDGGATEDGLPYFVMEYIEGSTLQDWCDKHRLSITERLKLFRQVCQAVHYAHQNLIVHRDLKPTNILVNSEGVPKLLDFGIAKLLNAEVAPELDATLTMHRMMTPDYASPEQVRGEKITTASDIYSLGVILYELLTGHRPYRVTTRAPREIEEIICQSEPDKPSTVVRKIEQVKGVSLTPAFVSETREGTPERLRRRLQGDLDNIILMAMRKEPQRRYISVSQLSEDIRRHLEGFAVAARSDTFGYRASKFIKRHRAWVSAGALAVLALIGGIIAASWQAHVANIERARAEHRFNDVRKLANSIMFELHDSIAQLPGSTSSRELLVRKALEYLNSLSHESAGDPTLERELALVYLKVGDVQGRPYKPNLGNTPGALDSYQKALDIYKKQSDAEPSNVDLKRSLAYSYESISTIYEVMGRAGPAQENAQRSFELRQQILAAQPDNSIARRELALAHTSLANTQMLSGNWPAVKENRRKAIAIFEELAKADPVDRDAQRNVAIAYMKLGRTLTLTNEFGPALAAQRKSLSLNFALLKENPGDPVQKLNVSFGYFFTGDLLALMGDPKRGLALSRRALAIRQELASDDPLDARVRTELATSYGQVGSLLMSTGDLAGALQHFQRGLVLEEGLVATDPARVEHHTGLADADENLAALHMKLAEVSINSRQRLQHLREGCDRYQKAQDIYNKIRTDGTLIAEFASKPQGLARKIAQCEVALAAK